MSATALLLLAANVLSLDEAVKNAQANQPLVLQAKAQTDAAKARIEEVRASLIPTVAGTAAYTRTTTNTAPIIGTPAGGAVGGATTAVTTGGGFSLDSRNYFSFGLTAQETIWDFQSVDRWKAARQLHLSQADLESETRLSAVQSVRTAYFTARANKALLQVADETLTNQNKHLKQIEGFVQLGTHPEIDLAQARSDTANARVQLINAENNYEAAKALLNQAMGIEGPTDYDVAEDSLPALPGEDSSTQALLEEALRTRPEFRSYREQIEAQRLKIRATFGQYFPQLTVGGTLSGRGYDNAADLGWNLSGNLTLSWQIFDGLLTHGQLDEYKAGMRLIAAQLMQVQQQARVDVEQARLAVRASKASLEAAGEALTNAKERLRLAEGRYQTGVGSIIELGDAQVAETSAAAQRIQAEFNLAASRAQLLHALGRP